MALFLKLQRARTAEARALAERGAALHHTSVAVITPYREQKRTLIECFTSMCGRDVLKEVGCKSVIGACRGPFPISVPVWVVPS